MTRGKTYHYMGWIITPNRTDCTHWRAWRDGRNRLLSDTLAGMRKMIRDTERKEA